VVPFDEEITGGKNTGATVPIRWQIAILWSELCVQIRKCFSEKQFTVCKHVDAGGDVQSVQICAPLRKLDLCKKVCRQMCATKVAGNA
jgi:hypothetical protein